MMNKKKCKNKLEINRTGNKNCWINDFSTGGFLIAGIINPGGPQFFKLQKKMGRGGCLIPRVLIILT